MASPSEGEYMRSLDRIFGIILATCVLAIAPLARAQPTKASSADNPWKTLEIEPSRGDLFKAAAQMQMPRNLGWYTGLRLPLLFPISD
jgi:hypothetical protein